MNEGGEKRWNFFLFAFQYFFLLSRLPSSSFHPPHSCFRSTLRKFSALEAHRRSDGENHNDKLKSYGAHSIINKYNNKFVFTFLARESRRPNVVSSCVICEKCCKVNVTILHRKNRQSYVIYCLAGRQSVDLTKLSLPLFSPIAGILCVVWRTRREYELDRRRASRKLKWRNSRDVPAITHGSCKLSKSYF